MGPFIKRHIPKRMQRLLLPLFAMTSVLAVLTWIIFAVETLPGGWQHMTAGTRLVLAGFAGIAILLVYATITGVVIVLSVIYESHEATQGQIHSVAQLVLTDREAEE